MNKIIFVKSAAVVAMLFSLLTIIEGSLVLLGITQHNYTVFAPLLIFNVVMAVAGLFAGVVIWFNYKRAALFSSIVVVILLIATMIVAAAHINNSMVSMHSVQAMIIRTIIWLAITLFIWKVNRSDKKENFIL